MCRAQDAPARCGPPLAIFQTTQSNIFSEQQEQWLGDAMADQIERYYRPVRNSAENAYLQQVGERLLKVLPKSNIQFRFILVDSAEVNGFSLAGGRVYLTRKLVANAQVEDEVAGVVAHEIGHILTHQFAFETTADLKSLLNVTSVGDRADVYAKFQRLTDARMRDAHYHRAGEDEKQDQADRVAIYAASAAGYRPQGLAEFWDRSFFVKGKTGNGFSDFIRWTKPNEKRLRELRQLIAALPAGCGAQESAKNPEFDRWRQRVVENQPNTKGAAPVSVAEVRLVPPMAMELERLRFSPDGRRVLAQDEGSVFVLDRESWKLLFRFDAEEALPATFTKDGEQISFHTPALHVERWSVTEQKLLDAREMVLQEGCLQSVLSPDSRTLLCIRWHSSSSGYLDLQLFDVETSQLVAEKKDWFQPSPLFRYLLNYGYRFAPDYGVNVRFSSDGDTVLLGPGESKLAYDLRTRTPIKLSYQTGYEYDLAYGFLGNDKVVGANSAHSKSSGIFSFPDGKTLKKMPFGFDNIETTMDGDYGIVWLKEGGRSLIDLKDGKLVSAHRSPAMDSWNGKTIFESGAGTIGLQKVGSANPNDIQKVELPSSPLSRSISAALSPGGRYLAYSLRARAGIWDAITGQQMMLTRGFLRCWWVNGNTLLAEFPKEGTEPQRIARIMMSAKTAGVMPYTLERDSHLVSAHLMEWKELSSDSWELHVHDPFSDAVLWSRKYSGGAPVFTTNPGDDDLIFSYELDSSYAKEKLRGDPALDKQAHGVAAKDKEFSRLIEVLDPATGAHRRLVVLVRPRSYAGVGGYTHVGDLLYLSVGDNRTIVYSLTTGQELRQIFGVVVSEDAKSENIVALNRRGEATVYDKAGMQLEHLELGSMIRFVDFIEGGRRLLVLTADQRVRQFEVGKSQGSGTSEASR